MQFQRLFHRTHGFGQHCAAREFFPQAGRHHAVTHQHPFQLLAQGAQGARGYYRQLWLESVGNTLDFTRLIHAEKIAVAEKLAEIGNGFPDALSLDALAFRQHHVGVEHALLRLARRHIKHGDKLKAPLNLVGVRFVDGTQPIAGILQGLPRIPVGETIDNTFGPLGVCQGVINLVTFEPTQHTFSLPCEITQNSKTPVPARLA